MNNKNVFENTCEKIKVYSQNINEKYKFKTLSKQSKMLQDLVPLSFPLYVHIWYFSNVFFGH